MDFNMGSYIVTVCNFCTDNEKELYGKVLFDTLLIQYPDLAKEIKNSDINPSKHNEGEKIEAFFEWLSEKVN